MGFIVISLTPEIGDDLCDLFYRIGAFLCDSTLFRQPIGCPFCVVR